MSACQNTAELEQTASVAKIDTVSVTESAAETESTPGKRQRRKQRRPPYRNSLVRQRALRLYRHCVLCRINGRSRAGRGDCTNCKVWQMKIAPGSRVPHRARIAADFIAYILAPLTLYRIRRT